MVNAMSQRMTYPNALLLGVDNVRSKLDMLVLGKNDQTGYRIWHTSQQGALLLTIIESWFQQNILPKNNSVDLYQKGSFTAECGPTVFMLDRLGC
jgi:hypothetical protein